MTDINKKTARILRGLRQLGSSARTALELGLEKPADIRNLIERTTAFTCWDHAGSIVEQMLAAGYRYGPMSKTVWKPRPGVAGGFVLEVGQNWHPKRRRPSQSLLDELGVTEAEFFENPPTPVATCSPAVAQYLTMLLLERGDVRHTWPRGFSRARKKEPLKSLVLWPQEEHPRRPRQTRDVTKRVFSFAELPEELPSPVCVCEYRAHVVLLINCDIVPVFHPETRERYTGLWVLGADGKNDVYGRDPKTGKVRRWRTWMAEAGWKWAKVYYNGKPLVWEPASERGKRQAQWSDKNRLIKVWGLDAFEPPRHSPVLQVVGR